MIDENYQTAIDNFENAWFNIYNDFDIWFTINARVIISHIPQAIARTGRSLPIARSVLKKVNIIGSKDPPKIN